MRFDAAVAYRSRYNVSILWYASKCTPTTNGTCNAGAVKPLIFVDKFKIIDWNSLSHLLKCTLATVQGLLLPCGVHLKGAIHFMATHRKRRHAFDAHDIRWLRQNGHRSVITPHRPFAYAIFVYTFCRHIMRPHPSNACFYILVVRPQQTQHYYGR